MTRATPYHFLRAGSRQSFSLWRFAFALACFSLFGDEAPAFGQNARERVKGVANFGRVTDTYFRGGEVTPEGLKNLAAMGVRTVIDLREEEDKKEAATCKELGITYYNFPMTTEDTPDPAKLEQIVQIISQAPAPVYVHCSGGKHRAGTVCAYFRIKRQGRAADKVWQEQQAYGFGTPEEHANLFLYIYGDSPVRSKLKPIPPVVVPKAAEIAKTESARKDEMKSLAAGVPEAKSGTDSTTRSPVKESPPHPQGHLAATAAYTSADRAIELARAAGGSGETVRINLEYDKKNTAPVWKVLFATGTEYRLNALTGDLLGTKTKAEKLSYLNALGQTAKYWTFQKVIAKAEQRSGEKVTEMELKSIRGRNQTFFEVMLADGVTLFFEAASGHQIRTF